MGAYDTEASWWRCNETATGKTSSLTSRVGSMVETVEGSRRGDVRNTANERARFRSWMLS
jgi:hypothetical protein